MDRSKFQIMAITAIALLLLGNMIVMVQNGAVAGAQEETAVAQTAVAGVTTTLLQYQGRLSDPDSGEAVADGSYTMVLRLYRAPSGGTPLWIEAKDVPVQDGLFSTVLGDSSPLNQAIFDGRALWLGIKVGADPEAAPRQQVLPVAYALGLVPGAAVQANSGKAALSVSNNGSGQALYADGPVVVDGNLTVKGKLSGSHANDAGAHHTRYTDKEAASAALSHPEIVTQYEFEDHLYGGMHSGRAIAYGAINDDGSIASATGNVSSRWYNLGKCYEITIDGHDYEWWDYVTVVTPVLGGGMPNVWHLDGKMCVAIFNVEEESQKVPFTFVTFKP